MSNAKWVCFRTISYRSSYFQSIASVESDSKRRNFRSILFESQRRWASFIPLCPTASAVEKEGFSSLHLYGEWKMATIQQSEKYKILGTSWSCFYAVGLPKYARCKRFCCIIGGPGWCHSLWAAEPERINYWGTFSISINVIDPSTARNAATVRVEAWQSDSTAWQRWASHCQPGKMYLEKLKWNVVPHTPYFPDKAPSDYYLSRSLAHALTNQQYLSYEEIS